MEGIPKNNTEFQTWLKEMPVDVTVTHGIIAGILLLLGLVLTFKGKRYFRHLIAMLIFIIAGLVPLYVAVKHPELS